MSPTMLHARQSCLPSPPDRKGDVLPFPAMRPAHLRRFGRLPAQRGFSLIVDLSAEEMGWRWCRGAATLATLCGTALMLSPLSDPLAAASHRGGQQVAHGDPLRALAPSPGPADSFMSVAEAPKPLPVSVGERAGLKRSSGGVSEGLYWSLRGAGASPQVAAAYLKAIAIHSDVGDVAPYDRFDFVVDESEERLIYAALDRFQGEDVEVLRWSVGDRSGWYSAGSLAPTQAAGLMAPVAGRITSRFGNRTHPILRFTRFHSGIDFGARSGTPIIAAADGQIAAAGWNGGYGRQVRIAHGGGIATSYSHMSEIAVAPGTPVRQGQVIGYVGSSGISTGPHLHFEVRVAGRAVDPLTARLVQRPAIDGRELARFRARLKQVKAIPTRPLPPAPPAAGA